MNNLMMILGPTQMRKEVLEAGAIPVVYPRTQEYSEFFKEITSKLQRLFNTKELVISISGSGTSAMQMAVSNVIKPGDKVETFNTGTFGKRWSEIIIQSGLQCNVNDIEIGSNVTPEIIEQKMSASKKPDVIFITYNETSTAAICNLKEIASITKNTDTILVVDAISSLGAEPLEMDNWGCDVVITGSQKFIGIAPGLSFIAFSKKAQEKINTVECHNFYFDAKKYLADCKRGQMPFTAPLSLLNQLNVQLDYFEKVGIEKLRSDYYRKTEYLRRKVYEIGFNPVSEEMGNCTTALYVPEGVDAFHLTNVLRLNYGISIVGPYPGGNIVRIGNFGDISTEDINFCVNSIKEIILQTQIRE